MDFAYQSIVDDPILATRAEDLADLLGRRSIVSARPERVVYNLMEPRSRSSWGPNPTPLGAKLGPEVVFLPLALVQIQFERT